MKAINTSRFVALLAALLLTTAEFLLLNYDSQYQLQGYHAGTTSAWQANDQ